MSVFLNQKSPIFILSNDKSYLIRTLTDAEDYIKIVTFQFTSKRLMDILASKVKENVAVEIITLPPDSYKKKEERKLIKNKFNELRKLGAKIYECYWEVGDASLTTTSLSGTLSAGGGEKWYSLHGKFIVTEKSTIITSLNFADSKEIEAYLFLYDKYSIEEFNKKFNKLIELFIERSNTLNIPGKIIELFDRDIADAIIKYYKATNRLNVENYPLTLIHHDDAVPGLKICPFDGSARSFLYNVINQAEEFCYIASERLFDEELTSQIRKKLLNSSIDFKIITNPPKRIRQSPTKAKTLFLDLISIGADIKTREDIHAKVWLNEKILVVGSANLSKMNLGFEKRKGLWRANTEILFLTNDIELIKMAKSEFEQLFSDISTISLFESNITTTSLGKIKEIFDCFGKKIELPARKLLSEVELRFIIESKQILYRIVRYSIKLVELEKRNTVKFIDIVMASILVVLSRKRATLNEIFDFFMSIINYNYLEEAVNKLVSIGIVNKNNMYYELNIDFLLNKT